MSGASAALIFVLGIVFSLAAVWSLAAFRAPFWVWTGASAAALSAWTVFGGPPQAAAASAWGLFLAVFGPLNVPALRRMAVSGPLLKIFRKKMPSISQTEREALEAGTVWWDADLFGGRPDWDKLLAVPAPRLSAEEQAFLDGPADELCRMLDDWRITEEWRDLPPDVWKFIKEKGFFGMIIPKKYGGLEFSALAHSGVVMKVSSRSIAGAVTVMVPNSLGPAELLLRYGTEEQKDYYLPRLARGEEVPCFALTGPFAGSDAASIPDSGVVCRGEFRGQKDVLGIRLNWEKRYITLAPVATVLGLAFRLYDPERLLGGGEDVGITLALIPVRTPGVSIGRRHIPLGIAFQNGPTWGRDVFIPMDWVIGGEARAGQGWRMLMESLAAGRSISLPALATGSGKLASRSAGAYARVRKQFRMPIGRFEGVQEALARIAGYTYLMDAARAMTAGAVDLGEQPSVISAIVKYHLTERMRQVVNDAMDVLGGRGVCTGPRNFMARVYQAVPISITVEGANILTRNLIIFGQGSVRNHPWVLKEMRAAADPDPVRARRAFDAAFFGHVKSFLSHFARTFFHGLTGGWLAPAPAENPLRYYYQQLSRMSAALALTVDVSMMVLGGSLKRRESLSARLGDVLSNLYLASAALKRFEDQGRPQADRALAKWACQDALYRIQEALVQLLGNFPNRGVGRLLRRTIFPLGKPYHGVQDYLMRRVAGLLLEPSEARDRLTEGVFSSQDPQDLVGRLEAALRKIVEAERVEKRLLKAAQAGQLTATGAQALIREAAEKGLIDPAETELLQAAEEARREAIWVDDFPPDYWVSR